MIAPAKPLPGHASLPVWHVQFLAMLPSIQVYAKTAFAHLDPEGRDDAVQEVIANAAVAFARLVQLAKTDLAFPTVLARYGVAQFRAGRRVGNHLRIGDVLSPYAQRKKGLVVERLDHFEQQSGEWQEAIVADRRTPVPDQVAFRIDFPRWLTLQTRRNRRVAEALAMGHSTGQVAKRFKVSPGRVSQLRQELHHSWQAFHRDPAAAAI